MKRTVNYFRNTKNINENYNKRIRKINQIYNKIDFDNLRYRFKDDIISWYNATCTSRNLKKTLEKKNFYWHKFRKKYIITYTNQFRKQQDL